MLKLGNARRSPLRELMQCMAMDEFITAKGKKKKNGKKHFQSISNAKVIKELRLTSVSPLLRIITSSTATSAVKVCHLFLLWFRLSWCPPSSRLRLRLFLFASFQEPAAEVNSLAVCM